MHSYLRSITIAFTLLCNVSLYAQNQYSIVTIKGKVLSILQKPCENVNVSLQLCKDSSSIKNIFTNKDGMYVFENVQPDTYHIVFSAVGFKTMYSNIFNITNQSIELPNTILQAEAMQLQGVVVSASKPTIENKKGKIILHVDASPTNAGTTALELLEKAPGVSVNNEGQISLKGKQGVLVMIDGKPSYLPANDLTTLLSNMSSSNIDQIEIISNPPAQYDAAGNAGIINIKTKKNAIQGTNGNISTSYIQGVYAKTANTVNLNYRNNNINIFGNYNYNHWEGFNTFKLDRNFYDTTQTKITNSYNQIANRRSSSNTHRAKLGLDYTLNKKNVIGIVLTGNSNNRNRPSQNTATISNNLGSIISILRSNTNDDNIDQNLTSNLNYKGTLDTSGTELNIDIDYAHYVQKNHQSLQTNAFDSVGNMKSSLVLDGQMPSFIRIYSGKADFVYPFKNDIKLETGLKISLVKSNNTLDYLRQQGAVWVKDNRSNHFIYEENINAAYINAGKEFKKWNLQLGLRVENTQSKGIQVIIDTTFTKRYTNVFPNINIGYHLNDKNDVNLSYSRRINRPDYADLNPFISFVDSLTYEQGNPNLKPEFNNNIEISHVYDGKITTTFNYSRTTDVITGLLKQNSNDKATYVTTDNLNTLDNIGLAVNISMPIQKWWTTNTYINVFNNHYKGVYQSNPLNISVTSFSINMTNNFTIQKGLTAELSGFYNSKAADGLFITSPIYVINAGIAKTILHNKGAIKLTVRDIFYSSRRSGHVRYNNIDDHFANQGDSRTANLTLTYRFGKKNIAKARERKTGTSEEESRIIRE